MTSVRALAARLGVAPSTVSRALHHDPQISHAAHARVWDAAIRHGLPVGRAPGPGLRPRVALLGPEPVAPWFPGQPLLTGLRQALRRHGLALECVFGPLADPTALEDVRFADLLSPPRLWGIILQGRYAPAVVEALASRCPLVSHGGDLPGPLADLVAPDHARHCCDLVEFLAGLGHRRFGLFCSRGDQVPERQQVAGFLEAAGQSGRVAGAIVRGGQDGSPAQCAARIAALARRGVTAWLLTQPEFIAPLWTACRASGLTIPRDLSVCCLDAHGQAPDGTPLTAISLDRARIGEELVAVLADRWQGRRPGRRMLIAGAIQLGGSHSPPGGAEARTRSADTHLLP